MILFEVSIDLTFSFILSWIFWEIQMSAITTEHLR